MDKQKLKKQIFWRYGFSLIVIITGIILEAFKEGKEFFGFSSVGKWMIYIGIVMIFAVTLMFISNKKRVVDERMRMIGMKAVSWTYVFIIFVLFITTIADGIKPITIRYSQFMSMLICGISLFYFIAYKLIERKN